MTVLPGTGERISTATLDRVGGGAGEGVGAVPLRHVGREATILVRVHGPGCRGCSRYLSDLDGAGDDLTDWYGRLVAVVAAPGDGAEALASELEHVELAADPEGRGPLAEGPGAGVVVFDRYGEVYDAVDAGPEHDFPSVAEVREWLKFLATQCPECGVPDRP